MGSLHFFGEHFAFMDLTCRLDLAARRELSGRAAAGYGTVPLTLRDSAKGCPSAEC